VITVLFFAKVRDDLGVDKLLLEWQQGSVADLKHYLVSLNGDSWQTVLNCDNLLQAVNQQLVKELSHPVVAGDEVAFFPPMTGG
jgi:molybdopterin synthase sulfur carrier subunit